jgi:copper chaperone CopZ
MDDGPTLSQPDPEPGPTTVELAVVGMHCQSCVALIEDTLGRDPGVEAVTVDLDAGRASVVYDERAVSVDGLCAVVAAAGYSARAVSGGPASGC